MLSVRRHVVRLGFAVLAVAGCGVGAVPGPGGDDVGPDGGGNNALCTERVTPLAAHVHDVGGTEAGVGCIAAGCHLDGQTGDGAPAYLFAGTLYKPDLTTPVGGAEIRLIPDAGGPPLTTVTDDAGNFYFTTGGATNPFPGQTLASGCPTQDAKMVGKLTKASDGNCNGGTACHQNPGTFVMTLADQ